MQPSKDISRLIEIMAALRTPVTGCPWDLEQSFASIVPYTIEEAYEVADAIERGDLGDLRDELGDLLLQVVYHARMAEETGAFAFGDVVHAVTSKMIRRHPHVFGNEDAPSAGAAKGQWDAIKAAERELKAAARSANGSATTALAASLLDDVPVSMPALTRATKLQEKAAKVGFDWPSLAPVFEKMREEIQELEEVALPADPRAPSSNASANSHARIEEEFGDLLFVMANVARHLKLDPENALRAANAKFVRRFRHIETRLAEQNRTPAESDLAEMDALWDEARAADKSGTTDKY
ncbi:MAG: nucleoside triphosphate pyrophosphohydrolase [Hyphomicrobium sp.]|jgi:ATP diphosphatase